MDVSDSLVFELLSLSGKPLGKGEEDVEA